MSTNSFFKSLLAGALLLAGSATFAQTSETPDQLLVGVYPTRQVNKICLAVEKQPDTHAYVQLLASTGEELYRAQLPKKGTSFNQIFDMNELEDGTYTLRVEQGKNVIVKSIHLQTTTPDPAAPARFLTLGN
ncbi:hypothetical protein [Spirosoma flavum]|uniref:T9SS type A sorting domain-containing protein n=1 Tax=Spirosoma flavum TaxID=2048557 RepID=A0ABW6AKX2_9BACT